jgi:hypothetical protein
MIDSPSAQRKIFISYKHKVEPDRSVVDWVVSALELQRHIVFIDKEIMPGDEWGKWIRELPSGASPPTTARSKDHNQLKNLAQAIKSKSSRDTLSAIVTRSRR